MDAADVESNAESGGPSNKCYIVAMHRIGNTKWTLVEHL